MKANELTHMRPVVEKELLHHDILFCLDKENLLDILTFQGGTSLRLCYGADRFSEDLDFTGGLEFSQTNLMNMKACIEHYIGERYGLEVFVKNPKELKIEKRYKEINVDVWQIRITTSPERKDLPKQMIKIEVINIPSYTQELHIIRQHYDFLPDGYSDVLINVESLDEILADKIISLVDCRSYIRYRDIWDIQWLMRQNAKLNIEFIQQKIKDYKISDYGERLSYTITALPSMIGDGQFKNQMSRFIPMSAQERTLSKNKFFIFLEEELKRILMETQTRITKII